VSRAGGEVGGRAGSPRCELKNAAGSTVEATGGSSPGVLAAPVCRQHTRWFTRRARCLFGCFLEYLNRSIHLQGWNRELLSTRSINI